jgi:hypothetical protein
MWRDHTGACAEAVTLLLQTEERLIYHIRNSVAILERKIRVLMQTIDQESTANEEKVGAEASQER